MCVCDINHSSLRSPPGEACRPCAFVNPMVARSGVLLPFYIVSKFSAGHIVGFDEADFLFRAAV